MLGRPGLRLSSCNGCGDSRDGRRGGNLCHSKRREDPKCHQQVKSGERHQKRGDEPESEWGERLGEYPHSTLRSAERRRKSRQPIDIIEVQPLQHHPLNTSFF